MKNLKTLFSILFVFILCVGIVPILSGCSNIDSDLIPKEPTVKYSDFGAVGNGKVDDFAAICAAHEYANKNNLAVQATENAIYYIGCKEDANKTHEKSAIIKTNTYWLNAMFIIDDKDIPTNKIKNADIFEVKSNKPEETITIPENYSLSVGQTNVGLTFNEPKLLYIVNKNKKDFIRSGTDQNNGTDRQEVILVDKNGNVDKSTPITWDYTEVTSIIAYPAEDSKLTVSGGVFTTIEKVPYMSYVNRGLLVTRPNVTIKKVKHCVTGECKEGSSYSGFYRAQKANNVVFESCVMWGRFTPIRSNGLTQGTYDISAKLANNITWKNCTQGNSIREGWGVMGSNHSRNLSMIGCKLSRFDAHQGVYNATIKNCELNTISVVGFGVLYLENVTRNCIKDEDYGEAEFLGLRSDYGATWHGDIIMKNCTMKTNAAVNYLIKINHKYEWNYGYKCYMPTNVIIDNVNVYYTGNRKKPYPYFYVFSNLDLTRTLTPEILESLEDPLELTKLVEVKNCSMQYNLTHNKTGLLDNTTFNQDLSLVN